MVSSEQLDRILYWTVVALAVAVVGFGAYFGWTVYRDRVAAEDANPSMRIANVIRAQIVKSPNDAVLRVRYGEALAAAGKTQEAIDQLNAALKIDPKHTGALIDLGKIAVMNQQTTEAVAYFRKVLDLTSSGDYTDVNDRRETALFELGRVATAQKDYDQAIGYFKEALRIRGDASDTYYYLALALESAGQRDDAIKQLEMATTFDPSFAQARYYLGELYLKKGDKINASYQFYRASVADPTAKEPKQALAKFGDPATLVKQAQAEIASNPQAALDTILIVRNIDPNNLTAAKVHAQILLNKGNKSGALGVYKEALKLAPDDAQVKAAIAKLTPASKSKSKVKSK